MTLTKNYMNRRKLKNLLYYKRCLSYPIPLYSHNNYLTYPYHKLIGKRSSFASLSSSIHRVAPPPIQRGNGPSKTSQTTIGSSQTMNSFKIVPMALHGNNIFSTNCAPPESLWPYPKRFGPLQYMVLNRYVLDKIFSAHLKTGFACLDLDRHAYFFLLN